jgi:hypothetical protein
MGGAAQVAMRVTSQIWQVVFASQTFQVFCLALSQKGTICSSANMLITKNIKHCRFERSSQTHEEIKNRHKLGVAKLIARTLRS